MFRWLRTWWTTDPVTEVANLKQALGEVTKDRDRLGVALKTMTSDRDRVLRKLDACELQFKAEKQYSATKDDEVSRLKRRVELCDLGVKATEEERDEAQAEALQAKSEVARLQSAVHELEEKVSAAEGERNAVLNERDHAQHFYEQCEADRQALVKERDEAREELTLLARAVNPFCTMFGGFSLDEQQKIEAIARKHGSAPSTTKAEPAPEDSEAEFAWTKTGYNARKAAREFSELGDEAEPEPEARNA